MTTFTPAELFDAAEAQMRTALGLGDKLSPAERIRLSAATALRLRFDQLEDATRTGRPFEPQDMQRTAEALEDILTPAEDGGDVDLTKFSDDELTVLEHARSIVDGRGDPGNEPAVAEVQGRLEREREDHRKTLAALKAAHEERNQLMSHAGKQWQRAEEAVAAKAEAIKLRDQALKLNGLLEQRIALYAKVMSAPAAGSTTP
jgi:hypothetical protein